jgi:hypothetical protein
LRGIGISEAMLSEWISEGYLYRELPGVYAVGHRVAAIEADLSAALLYAGPGAMLSHATAAWWWRLTQRRTTPIAVSTARQRRSLTGVRVRGRRSIDRVWRNRLPVITVPQTLLDYASQAAFEDVRYVLAEADYHRLLDLEAVRQILGRGRPGSVRLRGALNHHYPDLALTRSPLELAFLALCEEGGLPRPRVNVRVCGVTVDMYWPEQRVAVELDGGQGHGTSRQVARDHGRDLKLRSHGIATRRYAELQVLDYRELVLADLIAALGLASLRRSRAARPSRAQPLARVNRPQRPG